MQKFHFLCGTLQDRYCKLVLLTGCSPGKAAFVEMCRKSIAGETVALGNSLSELLLDCPVKRRALQISEYLNSFLEGESPLFFTEIEILFDEELNIEPLTLLKSPARNRIVIVDWPGNYDFQISKLSYAESSHPDYYEAFSQDDVLCFNEMGLSSVNMTNTIERQA